MPVRFKGAELQPVLAEAAMRQCSVVLVKDQGVYFMVARGVQGADGRRTTLAYAVGCNPAVDDFEDWWALAHAAFGGDDFGEFFDPKDPIFAGIVSGEGDLEVSANATHISLQPVAKQSSTG